MKHNKPDTNLSGKKNSSTEKVSFKRRRGLRLMGVNVNTDGVVKGFFGGNAYLAILFLLFICLFLWKSAIGFVPKYGTELEEARLSGIEASNYIDTEVKGHQGLYNILSKGFVHEKRARFGEQEAVIYVYEEFEGIIDDNLEDEVEEFLDIDDGPEKEQAALDLKVKIEEACRAIPKDELLKPVQKRIESLTEISEDVFSQALVFAHEYALNDFETPDAVDKINQDIRSQMGQYSEALNQVKKSADKLRDLHSRLEGFAVATYGQLGKKREIEASVKTLEEALAKAKKKNQSHDKILNLQDTIEAKKVLIKPVDTEGQIKLVYELLKEHNASVDHMLVELKAGLDKMPIESFTTDQAKSSVTEVQKLVGDFEKIVSKNKKSLENWKHDKSVTTWDSLKGFFLGTRWNTNSNRQSLYGILPLFMGSLLISLVAMFFAVPLAVGAAIYVNQFAGRREAGILKPAIEFIQAIPSVVLGLFGVLVVSGLLKDLSEISWLQWVPGFPITDSLNVLLAGLLLAFMASPTIFTLAEDALNNVPKSYTEASLALGSNRLQTALRVVMPASLSGIVAAVMLGFGRVIGETMVVLLVAGNMAKMPDFATGFNVIGQSVHTMTGIIASENGEAAPGTILWEALFMVGLVLFLISLTINSVCQRILARKKR